MKRIHLLLVGLMLVVSTAANAQVGPKPDETIVIQGRREAYEASWSNKSVRYIPFRVPAGTTKIGIKLGFNWGPNKDEPRTVDTGIFDPRGYGFGGHGFRGWQGGNASEIVITGDRATTSRYYIPGPIYPGEWNIVQRLLRSTKAGLSYTYTITFSFDGPAPPAAWPVPDYDQGVKDPLPGWYPGDLHLHTIRSDGSKTLDESVAQHESQGYRFMVSTDHNTSAAHYDIPDVARKYPKMLLICGEEWTTGSGHANVIGMPPGSWIDFRVDADDGRLRAVIDRTHSLGALFSINHPCSIKWRYSADQWTEADSIEVWNGGFTPDDAEAVTLWDSLLRTGRRIGVRGGSDTHGGDARTPATFVYANNLSGAAIMDGLRRQHVFVSETCKGPKLFLTSGESIAGDTVRVGKDGEVPVQLNMVGGKGMTLRLIWSSCEEKIVVDSDNASFSRVLKMDKAKKQGYVRAELLKANGGMAALTNAIYVEQQ